MSINAKNVEKSLKYLSVRLSKKLIYLVLTVIAKIFKRYFPLLPPLRWEIHLLQVQPVAEELSDAKPRPAQMEESAEEIKHATDWKTGLRS